jgi:hypothetical protein
MKLFSIVFFIAVAIAAFFASSADAFGFPM